MVDRLGVLASVYRGLVEMLNEDGHNFADLQESLGLAPALLNTPSEIIPLEKLSAVWELAYETRGATVGIEAAQRVKLVVLQDLGVFLGSSDNVSDWMEQVERYSSLFSTVSRVQRKASRRGLDVLIHYDVEVPLRYERLEFIALTVYSLASQYVGSPLKLSSVELTRPKPEDSTLWDEAFGIKVKWGSAETRYTVSYREAARMILTRNAQMRRAMQVLVNTRLGMLQKKSPLESIRAEIIKQLPDDGPSVETVAKALNLSTRSLQRRLGDEGSSFSNLLCEVREEMAKHYLELEVPVDEITRLLGYAEPEAFSRAFKRWTGISPRQYADSLDSET